MDKFEMTPEQQLAFDGFIDIMVQIYIGCLLMRKDSGSLPGYYEERNQNRGSHGDLVQVSAVFPYNAHKIKTF